MADERVERGKALAPEDTALMRPLATPRGIAAPYDQGYAGYGVESNAEGIHLRELWRIVRKRKWLVSLIVGVATILLTVEVYRAPSIYQPHADILVGKESSTVVQTKDQVIQIGDSDNINTNKVILKSGPLLEDVVVNLGLDRNPKFTENLQKKTFTGAIQDIWRRVSGGGSVASNPEPPVSTIPGATQERTPEESRRLKPFVDLLKDRLEVEALPESQVLRVSFKHTDPELSAAITNAATKIFIDRSFERKTSRFADTSGWLDRSTRELKSKVQEAQAALADYTQRNGIYSPDGKENLTTDKLTNMHTEATRAELNLMLKQSLYQEVKL